MPSSKKNNDKITRISPNSIEAEEAVLGCMLINSESVPKAIQMLDEKSFYNSANSIIFENMKELFDNNNSIDYVSLSDLLKKKKQLDLVGGAYYVTGLSNNAPSAQNIEYYANIVKEKEILRRIISVAVNISTEAYESSDDATNILDKAEQILFNVSQDVQKGKFTSIEPLLHDVLDMWGNRKSGSLTGVPSGFYDLDNLLSGFQKSDLIILAGRPSMGKTALALNSIIFKSAESSINIEDSDNILAEFESFFHSCFGSLPVLTK